jgi:RNA polymerase sigma-70 factor (ECF subfamily)
LEDRTKRVRFEREILPHLDAAHNLARWLAGNDADAADVVQEAFVRALSFFDGYRGGDARAWILRIVRNTFYTWLGQNRVENAVAFDEAVHDVSGQAGNPERNTLERADRMQLRQAIRELPVEFREALVLRDIEGLSYKEIAHVASVPIGTVMSRLARARKLLRESLAP